MNDGIILLLGVCGGILILALMELTKEIRKRISLERRFKRSKYKLTPKDVVIEGE